MIEHISYSSWNLWKECQHKFKIEQFDKLRTEEDSIHLSFGTSIHEAIEKYKSSKLENRITIEETIKCFSDRFKELRKDKSTTSEIEEFIVFGTNILNQLDSCNELLTSSVMFNEYPLYEDISRTDDMKIKFKGFIDIVLKTQDKKGKTLIYICDFKTCSWGWDVNKKRDVKTHRQLFLYKYFFCKKFNLLPKDIRIAFILLKKKPFKGSSHIEWFSLSAGNIVVQRALDELNNDLTQIRIAKETNTFKKNTSACIKKFGKKESVCPYYNTEHCKKD